MDTPHFLQDRKGKVHFLLMETPKIIEIKLRSKSQWPHFYVSLPQDLLHIKCKVWRISALRQKCSALNEIKLLIWPWHERSMSQWLIFIWDSLSCPNTYTYKVWRVWASRQKMFCTRQDCVYRQDGQQMTLWNQYTQTFLWEV